MKHKLLTFYRKLLFFLVHHGIILLQLMWLRNGEPPNHLRLLHLKLSRPFADVYMKLLRAELSKLVWSCNLLFDCNESISTEELKKQPLLVTLYNEMEVKKQTGGTFRVRRLKSAISLASSNASNTI